MMNQNTFATELYSVVDAKDAGRLSSFLTEDATFQFANIPAVRGRENIKQFLEGFYQTIKSIKHSEIESWWKEDVCFVTGNVSYVRPDDFTLKVPFGVLLKFKGDFIREWLIFVDNSELYK
jgi:ketosteroid isomerase-like protein